MTGGGLKLIVSSRQELNDCDIVIMHNSPPNEWFTNKKIPIIYVIHARPLDSFRIEQDSSNGLDCYTHMINVAKWPRVKKILYFWPEFRPFWDDFPEEKQLVLEYPTMDENRFNPNGEKLIIKDENRGEFNILLCDSWGRKDIDMFEIVNGVIQAGKEVKNFKFHFYGIQSQNGKIQPCWELLINKMRKLNILGEIYGRTLSMEKVYRSMDAVITPHRIITRVIGEALLTGIPVIASEGCKVAQFTCDPHNPFSVTNSIKQFINSDQIYNKKDAFEQSKKLYLNNYSREMNKVYDEILRG